MMTKVSFQYYIAITLLFATLVMTTSYSIVRLILFAISDYHWVDRLLSSFLLIAEMFILLHSIGYFLNILHVATISHPFNTVHKVRYNNEAESPPVAIVVASYKEPLWVLRNTLICLYNLRYANKRLYLLDDTRYDIAWASAATRERYSETLDHICKYLGVNVFRRQWHHAKAGIINDFIYWLDGKDSEGITFQKNGKHDVDAKYLVVFDADMNPLPDFVSPLAFLMEGDERLAFVQTPQYYSNFEDNRVARASGLMQAIFYEYICEAKGVENSMFCCGTNFIMRLCALREIGGFDETSLTEDFATSFSFHVKGWRSSYFNYVSTFGMGPEDLGAFFKQQYRWAFGTLSMLKKVYISFYHNPKGLSLASWWQYGLSSSYYLIGLIFLILWIFPTIYLFFNIPTYFQYYQVYLGAFVPYLLFSTLLFYWTLRYRSYRFYDLLMGLVLIAFSYPIYIKALVAVVLGRQATFDVTPKGKTLSLPLRELWPQIATAVILFSAIVWGGMRLFYEREPFYGLLFNMLWCLYYFVLLSSIFYFNYPLEISEGAIADE